MRGTAIAQVVFEEQGPDSLAYEDDRFGDDGGLALRAALLGVCGAAVVLALLPALVGITVLFGTTLPLRFEPQIGLTGLISLKVLAAGWGIASAMRASAPLRDGPLGGRLTPRKGSLSDAIPRAGTVCAAKEVS